MVRRSVFALFVAYAVIFIVPLGARPVAITDEARYAEIPREMIASGDWIVPHLDGLRYFEKPVLGYWLTALSMLAFGQGPFGARFSSAAAVGATAALLYWVVWRETGELAAAACSCLAYLTSALVVVVGTTNLLDSMFTAFATASIAFLLAGHRAEPATRRTVLLTLSGLSCAMAFMTKGFIAFALPFVVFVPFLLGAGDTKRLARLASWPILVAGIVILPWAIAVHRREPDYWRYFFWEEHIRRFVSDRAQHSQPASYFVPILLIGALPWTPLLPAAVLGLRRATRHRSLIRFAACWFVFPFLFFSASRGKLATYILPCFPAVGILIGTGLLASLRSGRRRAFDLGSGLVAATSAIGGVLVAIAQLLPRVPVRLYASDRGPIWLVAFLALMACSVLAAGAIRAKAPVPAFVALALAPMVLFATIPFAVPDALISARSADAFLRLHEAAVPPNSILVADVDRVAPVCWFFRRDDVSVLAKRGELEYGLGYEDSASRYLDVAELNAMIGANRDRRPVTVVTTKERYDEYRRGLPNPVALAVDPRIPNGRALVIARY